MLKLLSLAMLIAFATGCASHNTQTTPSTANAASKSSTEQVASSGDTLRCKYVVKTGTRIGTQICMKQADWDAREKKSQANARQEMERASLNAQQTQDMKGQ